MLRTVLIALLLATFGCASRPIAQDFTEGMLKSRLVEEFGEPVSTQVMVKRQEAIFGPIESFWSSIRIGDRVEIWSYPVEGGAVELYFINRSDIVAATGFAARDAVY